MITISQEVLRTLSGLETIRLSRRIVWQDKVWLAGQMAMVAIRDSEMICVVTDPLIKAIDMPNHHP